MDNKLLYAKIEALEAAAGNLCTTATRNCHHCNGRGGRYDRTQWP